MKYKEVSDFLVEKLKTENVFIAVRNSPSRLLLEICKKRKKPIIGKHAGTLQELALNLLSSRFQNPTIMTDQERLFIVRKSLKDMKHPLWNSPSYVKLADNRIREFKEHNIQPEKLYKVAERVNPRLKKKIKEAAKLLDIYNNNVLKSEMFDIFSLFEMAKGIKPEHEKIVLFFLPQILPLEIEFLNSLNIPITVFTYKPNTSIFTKLNKENLKLVKNWEVIKVEPSLLANTLSMVPEEIVSGSDITVNSYLGESEGIKKVALTVKALLNKGIPPEKIAVIGRDIQGKELLFYHYFKIYKIPFHLQYEGVPVTAHPVVKKFLREIEKETESYSLPDWCRKLKNFVISHTDEESIIEEIEILQKEIDNLSVKGFIESNSYNPIEFVKFFSLLTENRTYLIKETEPLGVFIGSPEAIPETGAEHIIFFDISNGTYPRAFPFDPDFSYREREEINNLLNISNPLLEALPGREKLIMYEFQTFFNSIAHHPESIHFFYDKTKGESIFVSIVEKVSKVNKMEKSLITKKSEGILKVYRREKRPENLLELGVDGWLKKLQGEKSYNFIFKPEFIRKFLPQEISVTDILSYMDCPADFLFSKLLNCTFSKTTEIIEGEIYHQFINRAYFNKKKAEDIFEEVFSEITEKYEDEVIFYIKPFIKENALKFIKQFKPELEIVEQEKPIKIKFKNFTFSGRIDWLEISSDREKVKIVDFKRGNVKNREYLPGNKKSFQIILYGLALFNNGDVFKTINKLPNIKFSFVSIPKFHPESDRGIEEFTAKEYEKEIKKSLTWIGVTIKLIKAGFFPPLEIKPQKKNIVRLVVKRNDSYEFFTTEEDLKHFTETVRKIFRKIELKLWKY
ncbi:PD-(D/E)XK nuclease family protein [Desulfurobacterium atlanticum]|uniref:PD-(D/E)XK nuclease superfamily protein n=1 Tax=Desulfurobacterium atlanticum TaxID=240169 RepID=A0A238Z2N7_9BACT|nr:PD-(D/E)XK nuclease family protein [Desulfurobacterium atlanticum]SNR77725.1 PD-(D/E)XK nuclease superfamily protein [Desulfurobacterium atlanticum]